MSINREEQMKIKKETKTLLAQYKVGAAIKCATDQAFCSLLGLRPATRIANSLLCCSIPESMDSECFQTLAEIRATGINLMNASTQKMLFLWDPQIKYIIETEFSSYMCYENDLYDEGIVSILISVDSDSADTYENICRLISSKMYHFLKQNNFLKE